MAKAKFGAKIAFGDSSRIQSAIDEGVLDERDLVVSNLKALPSLYVIDDDKKPKKIRSFIDIFDTMSEADEFLQSVHTNVMEGQPIGILSRNKKQYNLYTAKRNDDGTYGLLPAFDVSDLNQKIEDHINDFDNPHKTTYEQTGLRPMTGNEIADIVDKVFDGQL